jgi:hypothetical protein
MRRGTLIICALVAVLVPGCGGAAPEPAVPRMAAKPDALPPLPSTMRRSRARAPK